MKEKLSKEMVIMLQHKNLFHVKSQGLGIFYHTVCKQLKPKEKEKKLIAEKLKIVYASIQTFLLLCAEICF